MGNLTALIVFGGFCVLASYSYPRYAPKYHPDVNMGYSTEDSVLVTRLIEKSSSGVPVIVWKTRKAQVMAEIWDLTPADVAKPVKIFGQ